ncbi:putative phosphatidylinositol-3; 4; 5-trisphosphate 5-phosphatase [Paratrimastix pyriformis]|uniref:Phosphatidylinositol-3 n=1 Tax=Paratrimastix pyriformis TaxID=342808 RepID=A0ABQ8UHN8_9EUKA|nr:putative phosphatidylinositol-3; 4; 5-trisphosphate 5-phosphatase [Paratrimastix pyriformis]
MPTASTLLTLVSASLSCLGTLTVVLIYLLRLRKKINSFQLRLIFYLCCSDFFASISHFAPSSAFCLPSALFQQQFFVSSFCWILILCVNQFLLVCFNKRNTQKYELFYHLFAWGFPFTTVMVLIAFGAFGPLDETPWCWITPDFTLFRWLFFYGPLIAILLTVLALYLCIVVKLRRSLHDARNEALTAQLMFSVYLVVFVALRTPSVARRLLQLTTEVDPNGFLALLHSLCSPLTGFANAVLFFLNQQVARVLRHASYGFCTRHCPRCARRATATRPLLQPRSRRSLAQALSQTCCYCCCFPPDMSEAAAAAGARPDERIEWEALLERDEDQEHLPLLDDSVNGPASRLMPSTPATPAVSRPFETALLCPPSASLSSSEWAALPHTTACAPGRPGALRVWTGTWNMAKTRPGLGMEDWLRPAIETDADVVAVALQEAPKADVPLGELIDRALAPDYLRLAQPNVWEIHLFVYIHRRCLAGPTADAPGLPEGPSGFLAALGALSELRVGTEHAGFGRILGNKGAAAVGFRLAGTSLLFLSAHLPPFPKNFSKRNATVAQIFGGLSTGMQPVSLQPWAKEAPSPAAGAEAGGPLVRRVAGAIPNEAVEIAHQYDHVFLLGDLNYSIDLPRPTILQSVQHWKAAAGQHDLSVLLEKDQLRQGSRQLGLLAEFHEDAERLFPPTYKLAVPRSEGDPWKYNPKRVPAYTDRILWRTADSVWSPIRPLGGLTACPAYLSSDHVPLRQIFQIAHSRIPAPSPLSPEQAEALSAHIRRQGGFTVVVQFQDVSVPKLEALSPDGSADPFLKIVSFPSGDSLTAPAQRMTLSPSWSSPALAALRFPFALPAGRPPGGAPTEVLLAQAFAQIRLVLVVGDMGLVDEDGTMGQAAIALAGVRSWGFRPGGVETPLPGFKPPVQLRFVEMLTRLGSRTGVVEGTFAVFVE